VNCATDTGSEHIRSAISTRIPCYQIAATNAAKTYNPDILGPQIADAINRHLLTVAGANHLQVVWKTGTYNVDFVIKPKPGEHPLWVANALTSQMKQLYCGNEKGNWWTRAMGAPIFFTFRDPDRNVIRGGRLDPRSC
jgi:hypothetical protein